MFTYSIWYYVLSIDGHHPSVNPSPQIPHITTTAHSINLKRKGLVQLHSNNTMTTITTTSTITIILVITVSSALAMTWIAMKQYECTTIHSIYQSITDCMNVSITSFHYLRVKACDRAAKAFIGHLFITTKFRFVQRDKRLTESSDKREGRKSEHRSDTRKKGDGIIA